MMASLSLVVSASMSNLFYLRTDSFWKVTMGKLISTMLVLDVMMQKQMSWALLMFLVFMNLEFKIMFNTPVQY